LEPPCVSALRESDYGDLVYDPGHGTILRVSPPNQSKITNSGVGGLWDSKRPPESEQGSDCEADLGLNADQDERGKAIDDLRDCPGRQVRCDRTGALEGRGSPPGASKPATGRRFQGARYWVLVVLSGALALLYYTVYLDRYQVEARILCPGTVFQEGPSRPVSLEEEIRILKSPGLAQLVAMDIIKRDSPVPTAWPVKAAAVSSLPAYQELPVFFAAEEELTNVGAFLEWFPAAMSVSSNSASGIISVSFTGRAPAFLRAVLDSHLRNYRRHRTVLISQQKKHSRQGESVVVPGRYAIGENASERLQTVRLQVKGCELALRQMKSGKGIFRGFVPETYLKAMPSLKIIQSKIVELEIEKMTLAARFKAGSREIRAKSEQIRNLRNVMGECVTGHLAFLKSIQMVIAAEVNELKRGTGPVVSHKRLDEAPFLHTVSTDGHFQGGKEWPDLLEQPYISRRPLLTWIREHAGRIFRGQSLSVDTKIREAGGEWVPRPAPCFPPKEVSRAVDDVSWKQEALFGPGGRTTTLLGLEGASVVKESGSPVRPVDTSRLPHRLGLTPTITGSQLSMAATLNKIGGYDGDS